MKSDCGICSPSEANYCSNPFEVLTNKYDTANYGG